MAKIDKIWLATLTSDDGNAGTNDPIHISINDGNGPDKVQIGFDRTVVHTQTSYLAAGRANLFIGELKPQNGLGFDSGDNLPANSIRLNIGGENEWTARHLIMWGSAESGTVVPMALHLDESLALSGNRFEGPASIPLRKARGDNILRRVEIKQLLMVVVTETEVFPGAVDGPVLTKFISPGTNDRIRLSVRKKDGTVICDHEIPDTPQRDLEPAEANIYKIPLLESFKRPDLNDTSVNISISGNDAWQAKRLFLFGLDVEAGTPRHLIPLAHQESWSGGKLSNDENDFGTVFSAVVPLLPFTDISQPEAPPVGPVVAP